MNETPTTKGSVSNKMFGLYCALLASYLAWQIYNSKRPPTKLELPFDPNREVRQTYERRAMERQMKEWDEDEVHNG